LSLRLKLFDNILLLVA